MATPTLGAPRGGGPPSASVIRTANSAPLPHKHRASHLPLLPSGPSGVRQVRPLYTEPTSGAAEPSILWDETSALRLGPHAGREYRPLSFDPRLSTISGYRGRLAPRPSPIKIARLNIFQPYASRSLPRRSRTPGRERLSSYCSPSHSAWPAQRSSDLCRWASSLPSP